jgi:hypothetical protein
MPMPHQTDTIIWIPISEKLPPSGAVLASTKNSVHILQYRNGEEKSMHSDLWMDAGKKSDIQFEDIIAWAELPQPFFSFGQ